MKDVEPGLAHTSNAERAIERVAACLREIDCANNLLDRRHRNTPNRLATSTSWCPDGLRWRFCNAKSPRRRVTRREGVGENLIDFALLFVGLVRLLVVPARRLSFMNIRRTFHVPLPRAGQEQRHALRDGRRVRGCPASPAAFLAAAPSGIGTARPLIWPALGLLYTSTECLSGNSVA